MTYEYVCTACGHGWEAEQAISAAALKTCPKCGTDHAKRQISGGAGFILKGGGASSSSTLDSGAASSSSSSSSSSSETKTESKTETKTETKTEAPKSTAGSSSTP